MDITILKKALTLKNGAITINASSFAGIAAPADQSIVSQFGVTLKKYYSAPYFPHGNGSLSIVNASYASSQTANNVVIKGQADYLNLSMEVEATFSLEAITNKILFQVKYALPIDSTTKRLKWKFSDSFPDLPVTINFSQPAISAGGVHIPLLDHLAFFEAYFHVANHTYTDVTLNVPVSPGQTFGGKLAEVISLGVFKWFLVTGDTPIVSGNVYYATAKGTTPDLPATVLPWQMKHPVPGILLSGNAQNQTINGWSPKSTEIHFYSPPNETWQLHNSSYESVSGFEIDMPIGQTGSVFAKITASTYPGIDELLVQGNFQNLNITSLQELLHLTHDSNVPHGQPIHGGELLDNMQSGVKKLIHNAVSGIELQRIALDFTAAPTSGIHLNYTWIAIGLKKQAGKSYIWEPVTGIEVDQLSIAFIIDDPLNFQNSRSIAIALFGEINIAGVPVVFETDFPDFYMQAQLAGKQTLHVSHLLSKFLPKAKYVSDLEIDSLIMSGVPGKYYAISTTMAENSAWDFKIGPKTLSLSDIGLSVSYSQSKAKAAGSFSGSLAFGGNSLTTSIDLPGPFRVRAELPEIKLTELIDHIADDKLRFTKNFDLDLTNSVIALEEDSGEYSFSLCTQLSINQNAIGAFVFSCEEDQGRNGFVFGLNIGTAELHTLASDLDFLKPLWQEVQVKDLGFVFSTIVNKNYSFPELDIFKNPEIPAGTKLNVGTEFYLQKGLTIFTSISLKTTGFQSVLGQLLNVTGELDVVIGVDVSPVGFSLLAKFPKGIKIGKNDIAEVYGAFGVKLGESGIEALVTGKLKIPLAKKDLIFDITIAEEGDGALMLGEAIAVGPKGQQLPVANIAGIKISNLALMVGIDDAGVPSFGFAAQVDSKKIDSSLAVFLDSSQPENSFFTGAVSNINLGDVLEELIHLDTKHYPGFAGFLKEFAIEGYEHYLLKTSSPEKVIKALDEKDSPNISVAFSASTPPLGLAHGKDELFVVSNVVGKHWSITDMKNEWTHYQVAYDSNTKEFKVYKEAQVYIAPVGGSFGPGGLVFTPGFSLSGQLVLFGKHVDIDLDIKPSVGMKFEAYADPIDIKIGSFTLLKLTKGKKCKAVAHNTKTGPFISMLTYPTKDAKGKIVHPHFELCADLQILDLIGADVAINITDKGFSFAFHASISNIAHYDASATFKTIDDFEASLSSSTVIGPKWGPIDLTVGIGSKTTVSNKHGVISIYTGGDFEVFGHWHSLPSFHVTVDTNVLRDLPKMIENAVKSAIHNLFPLIPMTTSDFMKQSTLSSSTVAAQMQASTNQDVRTLHATYSAHVVELEKLIKADHESLFRAYVIFLATHNTLGHVTLAKQIVDRIESGASAALKADLDRIKPILIKYYGKNLKDLIG